MVVSHVRVTEQTESGGVGYREGGVSTMAEITPRWEWRSFGRRFGEAEGRLARLTPNGVQESDEIYLLSVAASGSQ
jgi:hypothetical protein